MNELALFGGAGGGILAGKLLGWRCVCAVERDAYAAAVLAQRQTDGCLEAFPIWSDVETFDGRPWRGIVDVVSGGFPCTDISCAGKGAGIEGEHSGLWREMARIVGEVRPRYVFVENSPMLVGRGLARVLGDLAALGYDAKWCVLGAVDAGAPHKRDRIWIVAHARCERGDGRRGECGGSEKAGPCDRTARPGEHSVDVANAEEPGTGRIAVGNEPPIADPFYRGQNVANAARQQDDERERGSMAEAACGRGCEHAAVESGGADGPDAIGERLESIEPAGTASRPTGGPGDECDYGWWQSEPRLGGMAHGLAAGMDEFATDAEGNLARVATGIPNRADRLKAIGNGQVPAVAVMAWKILTESESDDVDQVDRIDK